MRARQSYFRAPGLGDLRRRPVAGWLAGWQPWGLEDIALRPQARGGQCCEERRGRAGWFEDLMVQRGWRGQGPDPGRGGLFPSHRARRRGLQKGCASAPARLSPALSPSHTPTIPALMEWSGAKFLEQTLAVGRVSQKFSRKDAGARTWRSGQQEGASPSGLCLFWTLPYF